VAEAWAPSLERLTNYVRPDELHQVFNFDYLRTDWDTGALRAVIESSLASAGSVGAPTTWVLSNHDGPGKRCNIARSSLEKAAGIPSRSSARTQPTSRIEIR
jgi:hypothetical protein